MEPRQARPLVPPFRFAIVEASTSVQAASASRAGLSSVYRSGYPTLINHQFLAGLGLKTVVSLLPADPVADLTRFCQVNGVANIHVGVAKFNEEVTFTPSLIGQILELLINADHHPLLVRRASTNTRHLRRCSPAQLLLTCAVRGAAVFVFPAAVALHRWHAHHRARGDVPAQATELERRDAARRIQSLHARLEGHLEGSGAVFGAAALSGSLT